MSTPDSDQPDDTELLVELVEVGLRIEGRVESIQRYVAWAFWLVVTPAIIGGALALLGLVLSALHI